MCSVAESPWGTYLSPLQCPQVLAVGPRGRFVSGKGRKGSDQTQRTWQVEAPASRKGLDKNPQHLLCSHGVSHLPAPSSGQRPREVELPAHQDFRALRDRGGHPGPEGRLWNVGAGRSSRSWRPGCSLTVGKQCPGLALRKSAWRSGFSGRPVFTSMLAGMPPCPGTCAPPPVGWTRFRAPGLKGPNGKHSGTMQPSAAGPPE